MQLIITCLDNKITLIWLIIDLQGAVVVVWQGDVPVPLGAVGGPHVLEGGLHDVVRKKILEQVLEKSRWRQLVEAPISFLHPS